ncbi:MAG: helix-turn-helix domain-containing protein [Oscillatoria sp. Prado101]|jgi:transposase|nr:helix-turn-helix domain-containing protein [Oscillatoria sp. Prado101]
MPKRLSIETHLSLKELETRYRKAKDPVARSHWQIVWLLAQGKPTRAVVEATGYSATWVRKIAGRYNQYGPDGLGDRRHENPGGEPLLSEQQQQELLQALQGPAPDGGSWNSRKVAEWMADKLGRQVPDQRGWDYLQRLGVSVARPRRLKAR